MKIYGTQSLSGRPYHAGIMPPYPKMFPQIHSLLYRFLTIFYPKTWVKTTYEPGAGARYPSFPLPPEDIYKLQVCGSSQLGPSSS